MRSTLGLAGDLDNVDLVEDIEQAFGVRFADDDISQCETVGDIFQLVTDLLPFTGPSDDRCATAMTFYRTRRAVKILAPDLEIRPSSPIEILHAISVRSLYRRIRETEGLRPPAGYISTWGSLCLILAIIAPLGLLLMEAPWWMAASATLLSVALFRISPIRFPPTVETIRDLVETIAAHNLGALVGQGARLGRDEAWRAMQTICKEHAAAPDEKVDRETLILTPR